MSETPTVVVRFDEDGELSYHVFGDARLFVVDERVPHDRVYEITTRPDPATLAELVPDDAEIGSRSDARHAAIEHRVNAYLDGRRPLALVPTPPTSGDHR